MNRSANLLYPLDRFYAQAGWPLPSARPFQGQKIPEPYRQILVHNRGMTSTLEAFHQDRIHLSVLARRQDDGALRRQVVLCLGDSRPVEFAAIVIFLNAFSAAARGEILEGRRPFGAILNAHRIEHQGSPLLYLRVISDDVINAALHLTQPQPLYGRRNVIRDPNGRTLAETLEILPPADHAPVTCPLGGRATAAAPSPDMRIEIGALRHLKERSDLDAATSRVLRIGRSVVNPDCGRDCRILSGDPLLRSEDATLGAIADPGSPCDAVATMMLTPGGRNGS